MDVIDRLIVFFMDFDNAFFKKIKGIADIAFFEQNCSCRNSTLFDNF